MLYLPLFKQTIDLVKTHKKISLFVLTLFFVGFFIGFNTPIFITQWFLGMISQEFMAIMTDNPWQLWYNIGANNLFVTSITLLLSVVVLPPLFITIMNGFIIGIFTDITLRLNQIDNTEIWSFFIAILPHGVIELPLFLFNAMVALIIPYILIVNPTFFPTKKSFFIWLSKYYLLILLPGIIIAAGIESFITPYFIQKYESNILKEKEKIYQPHLLNEQDFQNFNLELTEITHTKTITHALFLSELTNQNGLSLNLDQESITQAQTLATLNPYTQTFINTNQDQALLITWYSLEANNTYEIWQSITQQNTIQSFRVANFGITYEAYNLELQPEQIITLFK